MKTVDEVSALEKFDEIGTCETNMESNDFKEEDVKLNVLDQAWLEWKDFNVQDIYESSMFLIYLYIYLSI